MSSVFVKTSFPSAKSVIFTAATAAMFVRLIPDELRRYAITKFRQFLSTFSSETTLMIEEYEGLNKNRLYSAAALYVGTIAGPSTRSFTAYLLERDNKIDLSPRDSEVVLDIFGGIPLKWSTVARKIPPRVVRTGEEDLLTSTDEIRYLVLTFHKKHKEKVVDEYFPYILERSEAVDESRKSLRLYTLKQDHSSRSYPWQHVYLNHPATFETLAMEDEVKMMVVGDLDMFLKRKEFYRRVGKAWKRGYLLYGPPGTGKSSLIAAMANRLNFDVYDLELSCVSSDFELRKLLITTANRSILVVEDIDASVDLTRRRGNQDQMLYHHQLYHPYQQLQLQGPNSVTLSGLLNFIDGLWSSIADERVIVFTTNHMERLDPALLRPGRMDVHIHMSYCTPRGFKLLANNYLGITEHPLMPKAEELITSCNVTPAEVGEQLMKSEDPELALDGLIKFLESKMAHVELARIRAEAVGHRVAQVREVARGSGTVHRAEMYGNGRMIRDDEAARARVAEMYGNGRMTDDEAARARVAEMNGNERMIRSEAERELRVAYGFVEQGTGNVGGNDRGGSGSGLQEREVTHENGA